MKSLSSVLDNLIKNSDLESKINQYRIFNDWTRIVGEHISEHAKPEKIVNEILYVKVVNPTWKTELNFMRSDLLKKINSSSKQTFKNIKII